MNEENQQENLNQKEHTYNKGDKFLLKMCGILNSTKMYICDPTRSQQSEIMALLGHVKVKSQTPSIFATFPRTRNKCSSIMGQYDIHECTQL